MADDQTYLDELKEARRNLILGKRITSTGVAGDSAAFAEVGLDKLNAEIARVEAVLGVGFAPRTYASNGGRG